MTLRPGSREALASKNFKGQNGRIKPVKVTMKKTKWEKIALY